uniref:RNA helicase n=1 Tax=Panagrolaimus sp. ES5 TaxID=591445 RepID=A0AC34FJJ6_9BILA
MPDFAKPEENVPPLNYPEKDFVDPNLKKEDTPLYKDDANVTVIGVKGNRLCENWKEMDFDKQLLANIRNCRFVWPRKVQEAVLPFVVDGYDVQCQSETGTGKTASYLIPLIDNLMKQIHGRSLEAAPLCIVIAPTREFVEQIYQEARKLTNGTGITVVAAYGGKETDVEMLTHCNIICACLGRLLNLLKGIPKRYAQIKYLVVDEIDHFLQGNQKMDFLTLLKLLPSVQERQSLFFSPTLPTNALKKFEDEQNEYIKKVAEKERVKKQAAEQKRAKEALGVQIEDEYEIVQPVAIVAKKEKAAEKFVLYNHKKSVHITSVAASNQRIKYIIEQLPSEAAKFLHLTSRISEISRTSGTAPGEYRKIIIFVNTIDFADELTKDLTTAGFPADVIHSDLPQVERDEALSNFKNGKSNSRILVSVNLCSCGVDIPEMDFVINYNLPDSRKNIVEAKNIFIQRCGRTGRKESGTAITFYVESKDKLSAFWLREILQKANQDVPPFLKDRIGFESYMEQLSLE